MRKSLTMDKYKIKKDGANLRRPIFLMSTYLICLYRYHHFNPRTFVGMTVVLYHNNYSLSTEKSFFEKSIDFFS